MKHHLSCPRVAAATLAAAIAAATPAHAQISQTGGVREARLSGLCQSIEDRQSVTLSIGDARIRRGGAARVTGVRQSVVVEAGGTADVQATASVIYVMRGGTATIGGSRNQVVAEPGGNVVVVGTALMNIVETIDLRPHDGSSACR